MKYFFSLLIVLQSCNPYKEILFFSEPTNGEIKGEESKYTLVMTSSYGCGYCFIALRELKEISLCENVEMYVLDYSDKKFQSSEKYEKYKDYYKFVYAEKTDKLNKMNYFPQFFLYKENELIYNSKGWNDNLINNLNKYVECF